jgi:hypothetical protein
VRNLQTPRSCSSWANLVTSPRPTTKESQEQALRTGNAMLASKLQGWKNKSRGNFYVLGIDYAKYRKKLGR